MISYFPKSPFAAALSRRNRQPPVGSFASRCSAGCSAASWCYTAPVCVHSTTVVYSYNALRVGSVLVCDRSLALVHRSCGGDRRTLLVFDRLSLSPIVCVRGENIFPHVRAPRYDCVCPPEGNTRTAVSAHSSGPLVLLQDSRRRKSLAEKRGEWRQGAQSAQAAGETTVRIGARKLAFCRVGEQEKERRGSSGIDQCVYVWPHYIATCSPPSYSVGAAARVQRVYRGSASSAERNVDDVVDFRGLAREVVLTSTARR